MAEPIVEVTRNMTATEIRMRQEESSLKMAAKLNNIKHTGGRMIFGIDFAKEYINQMKKEKEDIEVYSEKRDQEL